MERYRNFVRIEQMKEDIRSGQVEAALELAEQLSPEKVRSASDLSIMADLYLESGMLVKAKACLTELYTRKRTRGTLMKLINLSIRLKAANEAEKYLLEFREMAPGDFYNYIFRYNIDKLKGRPAEVLIESLEALKAAEYIDCWAYELAKMYHKRGDREKCIQECNDIEIWFGDGEYVDRAKALRAYYLGEIDISEAAIPARDEQPEEYEQTDERAEDASASEAQSEAADAVGKENEREFTEDDFTDDIVLAAEVLNAIEGVGSDDLQEITSDMIPAIEYPEDEDESDGAEPEHQAVADETVSRADGSTEVETAEVRGSDVYLMEYSEEDFGAEGRATEDSADREGAEYDGTEHDGAGAGDAGDDATEDDGSESDEAESDDSDNDGAEYDGAEDDAAEPDDSDDDSAESDGTESDDADKEGAEYDGAEDDDVELDDSDDGSAESDDSESDEADNDGAEYDGAEDDAAEPDDSDDDSAESDGTETDGADRDADNSGADNEVLEAVFGEDELVGHAYKGLKTTVILEDSCLGRFLKERNAELQDYFGFFAYQPDVRSQLVRVLEILLKAQGRNNCLIVTGEHNSGAKGIIKGLTRIMQHAGILSGQQVAFTDAEKINGMQLSEKAAQLKGCCLAIGSAGRLSTAAVEELLKANVRFAGKTAIVLTDYRNEITSLLRENRELNSIFPLRIHIPSFDAEDAEDLMFVRIEEQGYVLSRPAYEMLEKELSEIVHAGQEGLMTQVDSLMNRVIDKVETRNAKGLLNGGAIGEDRVIRRGDV